jgi:hypothetical protein
MYSAVVAEQLRSRGHDVVSVHDRRYCRLEGAPDEEVFAIAASEQRILVTENVPDFHRLEGEALAAGIECPGLIFTTNRRFPRGDPATIGRLVLALDRLLGEDRPMTSATFLSPG